MNIKEAVHMLKSADVSNKSLLIEGLHGIGKSEVVRQYAKQNDMHLETCIMSLMDTSDLMGMPKTAEVSGLVTTVWAAPDWYSRIVNAAWPNQLKVSELVFNDPTLEKAFKSIVGTPEYVSRSELNDVFCTHYNLSSDELHIIKNQTMVSYNLSKRSIFFADELNRAPSDILNSSLQLFLDDRLHSHHLPFVDGQPTLKVAAINPDDGEYTVQSFDPALMDRFVFTQMEPDLKAWLSYARETDVHPVVIDFLTTNPKYLHYTPKNEKVGSTPRSWVALSTYLKALEAPNSPLSKDVITFYIKGTIGQSLSAEFLIHYNGYSKALSVEDIEKLVKTKSKKITDLIKLGEAISNDKKVQDIESIQRMDLADQLQKKYISEETVEGALPYLAFLYSLPAENLAAHIVSTKDKDDNKATYMALVNLDDLATGKELLRRVLNGSSSAA